MKITKLLIRTKHSKYSIFIGSKLISNLSEIIEKQSIQIKKCLLVIDKNAPKKKVYEIKKKLNKKKLFFHYIRANEKNKNQDTTNKILEILLKRVMEMSMSQKMLITILEKKPKMHKKHMKLLDPQI